MERKDLLTGETFIPQRINQVFASSANRITFHNVKATKLRHNSAYVNKPLHRNLKILNELMFGKKEQKFHKQFLIGKGYSFNVFTHYQKIENKNIPCIYNYALSLTEGDFITITDINKDKND
jgi:hypothetical protein